jgi:hypothetical protein
LRRARFGLAALTAAFAFAGFTVGRLVAAFFDRGEFFKVAISAL